MAVAHQHKIARPFSAVAQSSVTTTFPPSPAGKYHPARYNARSDSKDKRLNVGGLGVNSARLVEMTSRRPPLLLLAPLLLAADEHRTVDVLDDVVADAAEDRATNAAQAARSDHDHRHRLAVGYAADYLARLPPVLRPDRCAYLKTSQSKRSIYSIHILPAFRPVWQATNLLTMIKALSETQTLRAGCSKAKPKNFAPPQTPFPGAGDGQNLISWRWSLPLRYHTNPVW